MGFNKQLFQAIESGNAFQNPLADIGAQTSSAASEGVNNTNRLNHTNEQTQIALNAAGLTPARIKLLSGSFAAVQASSTVVNNYGQRSVDELFERAGTSESNKQADKLIGNPHTSCDITNQFFGVIQGLGQSWLDSYNKAMEGVGQKLGELLEAIDKGIGAGLAEIQRLAGELNAMIDGFSKFVEDTANEILKGIDEELSFIASKIKRSINLGFAFIFEDWLKDSCLAQVFKQTGTPEIRQIIQETEQQQ